MSRDVAITFDDDANIRVLDKEKYDKTVQLRDECVGFSKQIKEFTDSVQLIVQVMDAQASLIEKEKLKAIGQRNIVDDEIETRKLKEKQHLALIFERELELARLMQETQSLEKVEAEQLALLDKLSNNEI